MKNEYGLCLAPPLDAHDAAGKGVTAGSTCHDGPGLLLFITFWHLCSLFHQPLFPVFHPNTTLHTGLSEDSCRSPLSFHGRPNELESESDVLVDIGPQSLASHPTHVALDALDPERMTSSLTRQDLVLGWLCSRVFGRELGDDATCACDVPVVASQWRVGLPSHSRPTFYPNGNDPSDARFRLSLDPDIVTTAMRPLVVYRDGGGPGIIVHINSGDTDDPGIGSKCNMDWYANSNESNVVATAIDSGRLSPPGFQSHALLPPPWGERQDVFAPHEAHGIGVIIKALVQQNAGAVLFLRAMVCVVSLIYFIHSFLVLERRPVSRRMPLYK